MANNFHVDQDDQPDENSGRQSNSGAGYLDAAKAAELPPSIKAIQEYFRPRFEAQDRRMEALAAAHFAARLASARVTHDLPADEALKLLERVVNGETEWPV
ncbi:hypothetical protein [Rhizobium sp. X9]|uniref:hypothetical protein n=1 Tax=Rhizobium sp. X9 TaxID=2815360 RepID=UPI001C0B223B|nr:hypothetical protein [Rhizobium sp. X9]